MTANPAFTEITDTDIIQLVDRFYGRIEQHSDLGPVFVDAIGNNWQPHLNKMYDFWSSVLNGTGRYGGRPMPVHMNLKERLNADMFKSWLQLFGQTAAEILNDSQQAYVMEKAYRIANSFYLNIFFDPADPGAVKPLERFQEKWLPVFRSGTRQNKDLVPDLG